LECPVKAECLQYALDKDERFGIFGGFSERERRRMKPRPVKDSDLCRNNHRKSVTGANNDGSCAQCRRDAGRRRDAAAARNRR
jgi:hypothetical protein